MYGTGNRDTFRRMALKVRRNGADAIFEVFDYIGDYGVSTQDFASEIAATQGQIVVLIASGGGDAVTGLAVYNLLASVRDRVTTKNIALAGSAASLIFAAGKTRIAAKGSVALLHRSASFDGGNAEDLRSAADKLEAFDAAITAIYVGVTGLSAVKVKHLIEDDAWLTADELKDIGLATEVEEISAAACVTLRKWHATRPGMDIRALLGLPAEATDEQVAAEVARLKATPPRPEQDVGALDALVTQKVTELVEARAAAQALIQEPAAIAETHAQACALAVERFIKAGVLLPSQKDSAIAACGKTASTLAAVTDLWSKQAPQVATQRLAALAGGPAAAPAGLTPQQKKFAQIAGCTDEQWLAQNTRITAERADHEARMNRGNR